MEENKENIIKQIYKKHKVKRYLTLLLGLFICAVSFNLFIYPNDIVFGGVSGISIIVTKFFDISASTFILISSIILLIVSYIFLGKEKTKGSVVGSILLPIFISLTENIGKILVIDASDQLLLAIVGGVLYGLGAGLVFKAGYTTGGTDVLNQIMNKYAKTSIGTSMLIVDGLIVLSGAFVFGWTKFMYAIIVLYIISILTDKVLLGISSSKAFYIITTKPDEISNYVIDELGHSVTIIDAKGGYTKQKNPILFTVVPTKEYYKLKAGINEIDKDAFFTAVDAYEVLGGE
mgnify:FL=1